MERYCLENIIKYLYSCILIKFECVNWKGMIVLRMEWKYINIFCLVKLVKYRLEILKIRRVYCE